MYLGYDLKYSSHNAMNNIIAISYMNAGGPRWGDPDSILTTNPYLVDSLDISRYLESTIPQLF